MKLCERLTGVWSAAPTPFDENFHIDSISLAKMVEHHIRIGINGLFLLGTNGEGPCLDEKQKIETVKAVVRYNKGRILIAVQITDNSAYQMIENAKKFSDAGADILIMSAPYFFPRPDEKRLFSLYEKVLDSVNMPFGFYDRGKYASVMIPLDVLKKLYKTKKIIIIKDSSSEEERMKIAFKAKTKNKNLRLFNGNEFDCVKYLVSGYDGLLLGGGVFNGYIAGKIIEAVRDGKVSEAERWQYLMNKIMYKVYGGKKIKCWLAGEKYLLVKMGIFNTWKNLYEYQLLTSCKKTIDNIFQRYFKLFLPYMDKK
ncbi:MAG: dihydrodipicolinate synthase family protein [bacterium]|nr:dihydrodipicolinate synthase family protein [bacterium]